MSNNQKNICRAIFKAILTIKEQSPYKKRVVTLAELHAFLAEYKINLHESRIMDYITALAQVKYVEVTHGEAGFFIATTSLGTRRYNKFASQKGA